LDRYVKNPQYFYGLSALMLSTLACQPVLAIGWREMVLILLMIVLLIGPPAYRFLRRLEKWREKKNK
jgi:hypothetical protein